MLVISRNYNEILKIALFEMIFFKIFAVQRLQNGFYFEKYYQKLGLVDYEDE